MQRQLHLRPSGAIAPKSFPRCLGIWRTDNLQREDQLSTDTYDANGTPPVRRKRLRVRLRESLISANGITYVYDGDGHTIRKR